MLFENIKTKFLNNRKLLFICMISTFIWGLIAHAYMFFNNFFIFDSINEFNGNEFATEWKIQLGRIFTPIYNTVTRGVIILPWLIGILSLFWLSISVFFIVKMFRIKKTLVVFILSGIFTVNLTTIGLVAGYIHDFDSGMFSLLSSVIAVYLWRNCKYGYLIGSFFVCISLGIYQSYISVIVTLIIIYSILDLCSGIEIRSVLLNFLKSITMSVFGGIMYVISICVVCGITGVSLTTGEYNSLFRMGDALTNIGTTLVSSYIHTIKLFLSQTTTLPRVIIILVNSAILFVSGVLLFFVAKKRRISKINIAVIVLLLIMFPFSLNIAKILANGLSHDLMHYAFNMVYLFVFLIIREANKEMIFERNKTTKLFKIIPILLCNLILLTNLQLSNKIYMKVGIESESTKMHINRILYRIEENDNYVSGETEVVFVGEPEFYSDNLKDFDVCYHVFGGNIQYILSTERMRYESYFEYMLRTPIELVEEDKWIQFNSGENEKYVSEVNKMPCYPAEDCIKMIDNVMVVKLGELESQTE